MTRFATAASIQKPHPRSLGLLALGVLLAPLAARAQLAVSPSDRAGLEGSTSTSYPLGRAACRLQELHADLGAGPLTLRGHAYRRDAESLQGKVSAYQVEMSVQLSMSPLTPDKASSTFSSNEGQSPVLVLPRAWVSFPETDRPAQAPAPSFALLVPYATPFAYPAGGGTLCVDTTVYGNNGPNGPNANFTAYQDAHQLYNDGRCDQPGYRYGQGCAAPGARNAAYASFELRVKPTGTELDIQARYGMPTDASGPGLSALMYGLLPANAPWNVRPQCSLLTSLDAVGELIGANDAQGHWSGLVQVASPLPAGMAFTLQVVSGHFQNGVTLSDGSQIVVPPPGPQPVTVARIAHGTDPTSPTGTVSLQVPVVQMF